MEYVMVLLFPALGWIGFPGVAATLGHRSIPMRVVWFVATVIVCQAASALVAAALPPSASPTEEMLGAMSLCGTVACVISAATGRKGTIAPSPRFSLCRHCGQLTLAESLFCWKCGRVHARQLTEEDLAAIRQEGERLARESMKPPNRFGQILQGFVSVGAPPRPNERERGSMPYDLWIQLAWARVKLDGDTWLQCQSDRVNRMETLLQSQPSEILVENLRTVSTLKDPEFLWFTYKAAEPPAGYKPLLSGEGESHGTIAVPHSNRCDCSMLRRLAVTELMRRGERGAN